MTRWIQLAACVALGGATAIGVAWGFALRGASRYSRLELPTEVGWVVGEAGNEVDVMVCNAYPPVTGCAAITLLKGTGKTDGRSVRLNSKGFADWFQQVPRVTAAPWKCHTRLSEGANVRQELHFGWPLVCMWSAHDTYEGGCHISHVEVMHSVRAWPEGSHQPAGFGFAIVKGSDGYPHLHVPTGVLCEGMAANTVCYAGAWWLILLAPAQLRTAIRKRRGQCIRCAYDLRATPAGAPCPECGNHTSQSSIPL